MNVQFSISDHPILTILGKTKEGAKLKNLKIQDVLRYEK
jgi:hypothetical protein